MSSHSANALVEDGEDRHQSLAAAFAFFNDTSQQLADSYRMLEKRVQELSSDLDRTEQERDREQQNKRVLASRMRALLDFLPGGVIVLDARGRVLEANPAAVELLQCELAGRLWREAITQCFAPKNDDGLEISTRSGKRISIATSSLGNDGQIILLTDQTETRRLQDNLARHERLSAMGKMVSALAHQIRTPLSAAILYAGNLCGDKLSHDQRHHFAGKLLGRLQHMEKQVQDMLLFVKSELPLNDTVTLEVLENGLRDAAEVVLMSSNIHCRWHNPLPQEKLKCHRDALISAVMNLINNAVQASKPGDRLDVSFSVADDEKKNIVLCIRDYGEGMKEEDIEKVMQMFETTKAQGTGLGLSVVQSVVRAHGGSLLLRSKLGAGTEAQITIPLYTK